MQLSRSVTGASLLSLIVVCFLSCATTDAHNITKILGEHPEFSTFNHYLTITHLAAKINRFQAITVCAVDNAGMSDLLISKHLSVFSIKNVLSLHVLLDYLGTKKLHQITNGTSLISPTMFQAAAGSYGFVNINTDLKGGKIGFGAEDNGGTLDATFVKSLKEIPYKISVIQISKILPSPEAEAPTQLNLKSLLVKKPGCKVFHHLLIASGAVKTFEDNVAGGLTVFCPADAALTAFMPKYKNLTAEGKMALLEYHGVPVYQTMEELKSNNGFMNTLATDGAKKFQFTVQNDGEIVTLKTKIVTAKITGTWYRHRHQVLALYAIDKVLLPEELFKAMAPTPAPAPAPETVADLPKNNSDAQADSPDGDVTDQTVDNNGSVRSYYGGGFVSYLWSVVSSIPVGVIEFFFQK